MNRGNGVLAWGLGVCALGAALLATGVGRAAAPEGLRGVWTAERSNWRVEKAGNTTIVQLTLRRVGGRGHWDSSHPVPLAELDGLTSAAMEAPSAEARFAWKRDAGAFAFEGRFQAGAFTVLTLDNPPIQDGRGGDFLSKMVYSSGSRWAMRLTC